MASMVGYTELIHLDELSPLVRRDFGCGRYTAFQDFIRAGAVPMATQLLGIRRWVSHHEIREDLQRVQIRRARFRRAVL